ncbi:MAG: thioredoxin family protein [Alphaproteobacteria bacterium]|nr:thioredoxin family protein [Alphaproteobacteria bacterium]
MIFAAHGAAGLTRTDYSEVELVAERDAIAPGETMRLALRLRHREHWHSYWLNPGDSGLPTEIALALPPGFAAGAIEWPAPHRIPVEPLVNYGYEGEFLLPLPLTAPADLRPGGEVTIRALASWLVCEKICVPEEAELTLTLPVSERPGAPVPSVAALFADAARARPVPSPWPAEIAGNGDTLTLRLAAPELAEARLDGLYFFAADPNALDHAAPQHATREAGALRVELRRGVDRGKPVAPLEGVLVVEERLADGMAARQAFAIAALPSPPSATHAAVPAADAPAGTGGILRAILFALAGGLLLNIMPCVFPVLFVKALSLARIGQAERGRVRAHGLAYTAGVLFTFTALAAALLAIRAAGNAVGWGFQLQDPAVILLLSFLMAAIGFNLAGLYEIRLNAGIGAGLAERGGLFGAFFTGMLAVIVATPCTAPFMGAAVGLALVEPPAIGIAIFLALGLGMATPFALLSLFPGLARLLPRPGAWMARFRQFLAFPMFATAFWLVWVLVQQSGADGAAAALAGILLIGLAGWCIGLMQQGAGRRLAGGAAALALGLVLALPWLPVAPRDPPWRPAATASEGSVQWARFAPGMIEEARAQGRPVLVNMTAAWCITCLVNERTALSSPEVAAALRAHDVLALKGDWTNRDGEIAAFLARHGRAGVPLYVLYSGKPEAEARILPQILTESILLEALTRL